jgi:hypothetical protein
MTVIHKIIKEQGTFKTFQGQPCLGVYRERILCCSRHVLDVKGSSRWDKVTCKLCLKKKPNKFKK